MTNNTRTLQEVLQGRATADGAGVKLTRVFGGRGPERFDPFLMLDAFGSDEAADYIAGFPAHPHRGFETITYMLEGRMQHEDHLGNKGLLNGGDVQWMTAAHGIIHSEMPQQESGRLSGFQLWLNLPARDKMKAPSYRDIAASEIAERTVEGSYYKLIAGELALGDEVLRGVIDAEATDPFYLDLHPAAGAEIRLPLQDGYTAMVYVYQGEIQLDGVARHVQQGELALLGCDGVLRFKAGEDARLLVLAGRPLGEPIAQYGPFVMNTQAEIEQAISDYRSGRLVDMAGGV